MRTTVSVIGLGYVGLPLAQEACLSGLGVVGLDVSSDVIDGLERGVSHIDDLQDADVVEMLEVGFEPTTDEGALPTVVLRVRLRNCKPRSTDFEGGE